MRGRITGPPAGGVRFFTCRQPHTHTHTHTHYAHWPALPPLSLSLAPFPHVTRPRRLQSSTTFRHFLPSFRFELRRRCAKNSSADDDSTTDRPIIERADNGFAATKADISAHRCHDTPVGNSRRRVVDSYRKPAVTVLPVISMSNTS